MKNSSDTTLPKFFRIYVYVSLFLIVFLMAALVTVIIYGSFKIKSETTTATNKINNFNTSFNNNVNSINKNLENINQELEQQSQNTSNLSKLGL